MKALIRGNELVLLYHLEQEQEKGKQIRHLLDRSGIPYREMREEDLSNPLDWWLSGSKTEGSAVPMEGEPFEEEVMVFSGISGKRLEQLLRELKSLSAGSVGLKAVVTPHNKNWPARTLFDELSKEHRIMGKRRDLGIALKQWEAAVAHSGGQAGKELADALSQARVLWNRGGEGTLDAYDQAMDRLRIAGEQCFPQAQNENTEE